MLGVGVVVEVENTESKSFDECVVLLRIVRLSRDFSADC